MNKFIGEYRKSKITIEENLLSHNQCNELRYILNNGGFNLGSGHEYMEIIKKDDDNYSFRLETYIGGPIQLILFNRLIE